MNDIATSNNCVNCGNPGSGAFCANCGQKLHVSRLTLKQFGRDIMDRVLGLEGMLPRTMKGLFTNPGSVIREYVEGNRKKYVNPVSYYFVMFGIYLLLLTMLNIDLADMVDAKGIQDSMTGAVGNGEVSSEQAEMQAAIQKQAFKNIQFLGMLQFPFIAMFATIFFRKSGYNFMENIILPFYAYGHLVILNITAALVFKATGYYNIAIGFIVSVGYLTWTAITFYKPNNKFLGGLKMVLVFLLSYIGFMILMALVGFVVGLIVALTRSGGA
ncbi:MAG: DUF3667 domain-containing protein [Cyclobacteriaceae bacterium]|nr:DUF3667 domain-containing protein [Cyclobacteriaceae bacterium]